MKHAVIAAGWFFLLVCAFVMMTLFLGGCARDRDVPLAHPDSLRRHLFYVSDERVNRCLVMWCSDYSCSVADIVDTCNPDLMRIAVRIPRVDGGTK